jgi:hypothetical protein
MQGGHEVVDEIENYWNARCLSSGEAAWRILGFHITKKKPAVTALPVHLPTNIAHRQYSRRNPSTSTMSLLEHYFVHPMGQFQLDNETQNFDDILYAQYYTTFRLTKYDPHAISSQPSFPEHTSHNEQPAMQAVLRSHIHHHLSRIQSIRPSQGELFYLRTILQHKALRSFEDGRTVNGHRCETFQEAATELGLFTDEQEALYAMREAVETLRTPPQLRTLFVHLLVHECTLGPIELWNTFCGSMALDFTLRYHGSEELAWRHCLQDLAQAPEEHGKTLSDFGLPEPALPCDEVEHELLRWHNDADALHNRADGNAALFNDEQRHIYDSVIAAVLEHKPLQGFVDGKAGRGKTFVVNGICDKLRAMDRIVLATTTSAYAAQLYRGGRTTHSAFKVLYTEHSRALIGLHLSLTGASE